MKTTKTIDVREKILRAAMKLLSECGLKKLAQPQIAKLAKVPQGHMTYYFPKRSDLMLAIYERSLRSIGDLIAKSAKDQDLVATVLPLLEDKERTRALLGLAVESDENQELRRRLSDNLLFADAMITGALDFEPGDERVGLIHATLIGLAIQHYLADESTLGKSLAALGRWVKRETNREVTP